MHPLSKTVVIVAVAVLLAATATAFVLTGTMGDRTASVAPASAGNQTNATGVPDCDETNETPCRARGWGSWTPWGDWEINVPTPRNVTMETTRDGYWFKNDARKRVEWLNITVKANATTTVEVRPPGCGYRSTGTEPPGCAWWKTTEDGVVEWNIRDPAEADGPRSDRSSWWEVEYHPHPNQERVTGEIRFDRTYYRMSQGSDG